LGVRRWLGGLCSREFDCPLHGFFTQGTKVTHYTYWGFLGEGWGRTRASEDKMSLIVLYITLKEERYLDVFVLEESS